MVPGPTSPRRAAPGAALLLACLAAACGGTGGGGAAAAPAARFAPPPPLPEGLAGAVEVELVLAGGALEQDLAVTVRDTGTGSAAAGVDYDALGPATVVFPAGARGGARLPVPLRALADDLAEGPEDVVLELSAAGDADFPATTASLVLDDLDVAHVVFAPAAPATAAEADTTLALGVRLLLPAGVQLERDATVVVEDPGEGSAAAGSDYAPFAPRTVVFPVGALDGDQAVVDLELRDDAEFEGDETIVLELSSPTGAAVLGAAATHVVTILEDDVSQEPFLSAAVEFGPAVGPGDTLDLGPRDASAGPSGGVVLAASNLGLDPLDLTAPTLTGPHAGEFVVEVQAGPGPAPAAPTAGTGDAAGEERALAFPLLAAGTDERGARAVTDPEALAALAGRDAVRLRDVPHPALAGATLALRAVPDPWAPDGVLVVDGAEVPRPQVACWHGEVEGEPGSDAFLAFSAHGAHGWIRRGSGATFALRGGGPGASAAAWIVGPDDRGRTAAPAQQPRPVCDGAVLPPGAPPVDPALAPEGPSAGGGALVFGDCRLALETDHAFHQLFGDANATAAYATGLVAAVGVTYRRDAQTALSIAYLGVHTTAADPWTTPDEHGTSFDLLNEFRAAWAGGGWPAAADLAHFLSGDVLGGGVAYIGTLCNSAYGFGVSANLSGALDWGTFDGSPGGLNWDFVVVAHELGHNFGALHTHEYCPPLDECAPTLYAGPCQAQRTCGDGTLMSYCHLCSGGTSNVETRFHPLVANVLRQRANASCLTSSTVPGGGAARWRLRFDPTGPPGPRSTTLWFGHGASNEASPFSVHLQGTSQ